MSKEAPNEDYSKRFRQELYERMKELVGQPIILYLDDGKIIPCTILYMSRSSHGHADERVTIRRTGPGAADKEPIKFSKIDAVIEDPNAPSLVL